MRESEGKRKEVGTAERFLPDFISEQKWSLVQCLSGLL